MLLQSMSKLRGGGAVTNGTPGGPILWLRCRRVTCSAGPSSAGASSMPRPSIPISSSQQQQYHQDRHHPSQYQQQQRRHKSSSSSSSSSSAMATTAVTRNPFDVLGLPRDSCPEIVRQTFLQLAMKYHPDTSGDDKTQDKFHQIRDAFERITKAVGKTNQKIWLTEEVFNLWFAEHTGLRMDAATRREVMLSYRDGACKNSSSRTRYLPPEWQIAFILEKEGMFTKKLACNSKDFTVFGGGRAVVSHSGARRKRGF